MTANTATNGVAIAGGGIEAAKAKTALRLMQERFPDSNESDLDRFLRARDQDLDKAGTMYEAHLKWRSEALVWTDDDREAIRKTLSSRRFYVLDERDANGRPIVYFCFHRFKDGCYDIEEELRAYVFLIEEEVIPKLNGTPDGKWTVLCDVSATRKPPMSFLTKSNKLLADNYPERLCRLVMFPVPSFVKTIIQGMLYFVDAETRSKFTFVSDVNCLEKESTIPSWKMMGPDVAKMVEDGSLKQK
mmetsp:Transcript_5944/g.10218  ORF Transcript_5944/g.10218 Transcript_5944/m.10218 type:complete len:245 (-) Transcript_5944:93-827(-)|eukprot:CAMPEP_0197451112 /NCGR_PEP_ID=MMETSP1175-20131217/27757_1 /TAXON_ID=1003142 /ORGANISM="Triceratium dubium, Strain CCMP147" /LENGTH=244 /DNA_ID=CAMNT_0042983729 /DNA_START=155 /DNA_END=889 /DNA_ORIENTATION=+